MTKIILRCGNLIVGLICAIIEAITLGAMIILQKIYDLCERIEERADHAVNVTECKLDRQAYTSEDGFVHPEYETV